MLPAEIERIYRGSDTWPSSTSLWNTVCYNVVRFVTISILTAKKSVIEGREAIKVIEGFRLCIKLRNLMLPLLDMFIFVMKRVI